jgi:tetratricopeptide (TPR) repeat protein
MMMKTNLLSTSFKTLVLGAMSACFSVSLSAQEAAAGGSQAPKYQPPVVCAGYKPGKSNLVGERAGKKVQKAFEAYQADNLDEAILILRETKTSEGFDRAYVNKFLGNLIASKDDGYREALKYLAPSVEEKFLNDGEHAATLKMVADLSLSLSKYNDAIKWYNKWLDFTCKNSGEVHLRIATAYYEMEQYDKVVAPSDKAIQYTPKDKLKSTPYQLKLQSYSERKQYKNALRVAEDLVLAFPTEGKWWTMLGAFYMQNEQYKKSIVDL